MRTLRWLRNKYKSILLWQIFRHNFLVFNAMAAKLCKEQQISFGSNTKYSDFIDGKYFLRN